MYFPVISCEEDTLMETLNATPVRLGAVQTGHGDGRNHVLLEFRKGDRVRRFALPESDARLLMEEPGAALRFFRVQATETN
jgi:hypothetical protein